MDSKICSLLKKIISGHNFAFILLKMNTLLVFNKSEIYE